VYYVCFGKSDCVQNDVDNNVDIDVDIDVSLTTVLTKVSTTGFLGNHTAAFRLKWFPVFIRTKKNRNY
jgi:hypothetical protein